MDTITSLQTVDLQAYIKNGKTGKAEIKDGYRHIYPLIVSASRATDIPAFHSDRFFESYHAGYAVKIHPFNSKIKYIASFKDTECFVFWTKNPRPMMDRLDEIAQPYYFQFTLNNYDRDLEPNVPSLSERIETFQELSEKIGRDRVIWRFDPIVISDKYTVQEIAYRFETVAKYILPYTDKLVISGASIDCYPKVKRWMTGYSEPDMRQMFDIVREMYRVRTEYVGANPDGHNFRMYSCADKYGEMLVRYGVSCNWCIDPELIIKIAKPSELTSMLSNMLNKSSYSLLKDKGQRKHCYCIPSFDIGAYDTCGFKCLYCYGCS